MATRINDAILESSVYLFRDEESAESGEHAGGSGFLVGRKRPDGKSGLGLWVVTNRHVIEKGAWTIRINTRGGSFDVIDTTDRDWFFHKDGDDLAIYPIRLSSERHYLALIHEDLLLTREERAHLDIGPGDEAFVIGRFVAQQGTVRNTPTVRFGQIAQLPLEKIRIEGKEQESFLVEIRSIGGYSGSPVFVYLDPMYQRPDESPVVKTMSDANKFGRFKTGPWLLGVDWGMVPLWEPVCDASGTELPSRPRVQTNTGMMAVVPTWKLRELLLEDEFVVRFADEREKEFDLQNSVSSVSQNGL